MELWVLLVDGAEAFIGIKVSKKMKNITKLKQMLTCMTIECKC